jgi:hypothetical protein
MTRIDLWKTPFLDSCLHDCIYRTSTRQSFRSSPLPECPNTNPKRQFWCSAVAAAKRRRPWSLPARRLPARRASERIYLRRPRSMLPSLALRAGKAFCSLRRSERATRARNRATSKLALRVAVVGGGDWCGSRKISPSVPRHRVAPKPRPPWVKMHKLG